MNIGKLTKITKYAFDPDALILISALGITSGIEKVGVDHFVKGVKNDLLWDDIYAFWGMYGTSIDTLKLNWKNPVDADNAFRFTINGSYTITANKITPDGSTCYADTHFNPIAQSCNINSFTFGYYNTIGNPSGFISMGNRNPSSPFYATRLSMVGYSEIASNAGTIANYPVKDGHQMLTRTDSGNILQYRNGYCQANIIDASNSFHDSPFYLFAQNNGGPANNFANAPCICAYITKGSTFDKAYKLDKRIRILNQVFGRELYNYEIESHRAIFCGDSLTYGNYAAPLTNRFSTLLSSDLGCTEVNIGIPAAPLQYAVSDVTSQFISFYRKYQQVLRTKNTFDDYLFLFFGVNDIWRNLSATEFINQYTTIINYAYSLGWTNDNIIIIGIPYMTSYGSGNLTLLQSMETGLINMCTSLGLKKVELYNAMNGQPGLLSGDGVHWTNAGHLFVKNQIISQIFT